MNIPFLYSAESTQLLITSETTELCDSHRNFFALKPQPDHRESYPGGRLPTFMPETRAQAKNAKTQRAGPLKPDQVSKKNSGDVVAQDQSHPETEGTLSKFTITTLTGDLTIDPPDNAVLTHSVNCAGEWGSGVALALARALPAAYGVYADHCKEHEANALLGSCLLIPPQDFDVSSRNRKADFPDRPRWWVACLFTSESYGKKTKSKPGKSSPKEITADTKLALLDLRLQLENCQQESNAGKPRPDPKELWACKFNSGSFGVKWEKTVKVIEEVFEGWDGKMKVACPG